MKKVLQFFLCMNLCIMLAMPVSAAEVVSEEDVIEVEETKTSMYVTNYYSKVLGKLSSINGIASKDITFCPASATGGSTEYVTSVQLHVRVSGNPCVLYLQASDGTIHNITITSNKIIILDELNDSDPFGNWKVWIETTGISSRADITMRIYYNY